MGEARRDARWAKDVLAGLPPLGREPAGGPEALAPAGKAEGVRAARSLARGVLDRRAPAGGR